MKELTIFTASINHITKQHECMRTITAKNERINDLKAMILDELLLNDDIETSHHILQKSKYETSDDSEYYTLITK